MRLFKYVADYINGVRHRYLARHVRDAVEEADHLGHVNGWGQTLQVRRDR